MYKKIIPVAAGAAGGTLLGVAGAAGATKINRKRKMDAEMNTAIMNILPQSFTDEDRARIAREIMKGAESRTGSEKLAAIHQTGSLVFGEDGINDLFKEAVEDLRKEVNDKTILT